MKARNFDCKCIVCNKEYKGWISTSKYCSPKCSSRSVTKKQSTRDFQRKRREQLNSYKLTQGCSLCGYNKHPAALVFDHIEGEKSFDIASRTTVSMERLMEEIAKCRILCANCHQEVTSLHNHSRSKRSDYAPSL